MEDLKRYIFPAIAAIIMHGLLVSLALPKQETAKPTLNGNVIKIEINAISSQTVVPETKAESIPNTSLPKEMFQKKVEQKRVITQPEVFRTQHKKKVVKQEPIEKHIDLKDKDTGDHLQDKHIEHSLHETDKTPTVEANDKPAVMQATSALQLEKAENTLKNDIAIEKKSRFPIHRKAIPKYRQNEQPPYPVIAKRRGYEGEILLNVLVNPEGVVSEIQIKHSSGHLSLDEAALQTVKKWLFTPGTEEGRHVAMWVDIPISFQLR
jgi:protein TonB